MISMPTQYFKDDTALHVSIEEQDGKFTLSLYMEIVNPAKDEATAPPITVPLDVVHPLQAGFIMLENYLQFTAEYLADLDYQSRLNDNNDDQDSDGGIADPVPA